MRLAVATSVYEAARPYLVDWCRGVNEAAAAWAAPVTVIAAVDGLDDAGSALDSLLPDITVTLAHAPDGCPVATVRETMLAAALASDADAVVFCDSDDILMPASFAIHARTLAASDISVADLVPLHTDGSRGSPLFGRHLPDRLTRQAMRAGNVCGFSNTAVHREALARLPGGGVPTVTAVDWWTFDRLLHAGCSAGVAREPVALYRQHGANTLGAGDVQGEGQARRRLAILVEHLMAVDDDWSLRRAEAARALASSPALGTILAADAARPGPWFADTDRWLEAWTRTQQEALPA